jgi:hypothetical protein
LPERLKVDDYSNIQSEIIGILNTFQKKPTLQLGIATPKKESVNKTWSDEDLNSALDALRNKEISANKAAKVFGIPSSVSIKQQTLDITAI